jgi:hypothetical protein
MLDDVFVAGGGKEKAVLTHAAQGERPLGYDLSVICHVVD